MATESSDQPIGVHSGRLWEPSSGSAAIVAVAIGVSAAVVYYVQDLTLSHYDAKAHLVVARRIVDSLSPGWIQIGAVWLPLPHLLNLIPVQVDWFYRTGLSAVAFSVTGFVIGAVSLWNLVARATGSRAAAWSAFAVFAAHPDVLYLQATPMTESLLMGLCLAAVTLTWMWVTSQARGSGWSAGTVLALACLTRYEAWPITLAVLLSAGMALASMGTALRNTVVKVAILASYPAAAIGAFLVLSRVTVGSWLITDGFFDIDHSMYQKPSAVVAAVWLGVRMLNGSVMTAVGTIAALVVLLHIWRTRRSSHLLVVISLAACAALPMYAFWNGHPVRIRYMVPLTMSLAAVTGLGVGLLPRHRTVAAILVVAIALLETPPLSGRSPMVTEAQRDATAVVARRHITECLSQRYDQTPILASMGSLAPYMHETAHAGFSLRQYIHEGTGQMWSDSLIAAGRHAGWVLIEEEAEGGDVLARTRGTSPAFLAGFARQCEGGGVALYQRMQAP
jgi:hypothetical protein